MTEVTERIYGAIIGAAIGDALGAPLEFLPSRPEHLFVRDMVGGGVLKNKPGGITDDTYMALAIMDMYKVMGTYDQKTIIRNWLNWLDTDPKDVGAWTYKVLKEWENTDQYPLRGAYNPAVQTWLSTGSNNAGNGSVMRCMPTAVFRLRDEKKMVEETIFLSEDTHPDPRCIYSCLVVNKLIQYGINGKSKQESFKLIIDEFSSINKEFAEEIAEAPYLPWKDWKNSGYTVDTVKCALAGWLQYDSFEEGLIRVVNRGNDADTVGAVAGSLLGAFHGSKAIPQRWIDKLEKLEEVAEFCDSCSLSISLLKNN
jgi:ADP-ribosyl-[dinitrogen reductase] hydrolase